MCRYLYQFELHEKNKVKGGSKEGWTRRSKPLPPSSDEEQDGQSQANQQDRTKQQDKVTQQDKVKRQDKVRAQGRQPDKAGGEGKQRVGPVVKAEAEGEAKVNGVEREKEKEKGRRVPMAEQKTIKMVKMDKLPKSFSVNSPVKQEPSPALEESEPEDEANRVSDAKSEGSDVESGPGMVSPCHSCL